MNYPYAGYYQPIQQIPQQIPQQTIPQPMPQTMPQQSITSSGVIWITNEDTVRNYAVAPGGSVLFMHENEPYMYMKSADQFGKATIKKSRLVDESESHDKKVDLTEYIKREEIDSIITDKIQKEIEKKMSEISFKPTKATKKVVVEEEE